MQWRGWFGVAVVSCAAFAITALGFSTANSAPEAQPLEASAPGSDSQIALPKDTIIATLAESAKVGAPFTLREDSTAVGGMALYLAKGTRTPDHKGKAQLSVNAASDGTYFVWARSHWRDTCSNSFSLQVGTQPERDVGNDDVFNVWPWVPSGKYALTAGTNAVTLTEREDGIEVDQLLFTREATFQPAGPVSPIGCARGIRRFADTFTRSPGHGMDGWDLISGDWHISFSFDPNRIPNQYALVGEPVKGEAVALVQGAPWYGAQVSFCLNPSKEGKFGAVLDRSLDGKNALFAGFEMSAGHSFVVAEGGGTAPVRVDLGQSLRLDQWHFVTIERWAWLLRISLDGKTVLTRNDLSPRAGMLGLSVSSGSAVFDDVEVAEIPWQADDGEITLPWALTKDAKWFRMPADKSAPSNDKIAQTVSGLLGKSGTISTTFADMPISEMVVEEESGPGVTPCKVTTSGLDHVQNLVGVPAGTRVFRATHLAETSTEKPATVAAIQADGDVHLRRVAVRYGTQTPDNYFIGPYHFANNELEDPSDYLDFTPEEYKAMAASPEAQKLRRVAKIKTLIGREGGDESPWVYEGGNWRLQEGVLVGQGPGARLRHAQEICGDMDMRLRVLLRGADSNSAVEIYGGPEAPLRFELCAAKGPADPANKSGAIPIQVPGDAQWHELLVRVRGDQIQVGVDNAAKTTVVKNRGDGGRIRLSVNAGIVEFNDIEFSMPRVSEGGFYYPFNRPEPDWWRDAKDGGQWMDHGGIACVLASSWVSLVAPTGSGVMCNKRTFGPNVMVAFDVEENSEWFGWDKYPNHLHYPYDNIEVMLNANGGAEAYRLVLNTDSRSATVLYRGGKEIARVAQRDFFPMRFVGGHGPYFPRRNRICLIKRDGLLRAVVNGVEVLHFEDKDPLKVEEVALGGHHTRINFTDIEIRSLKQPEK